MGIFIQQPNISFVFICVGSTVCHVVHVLKRVRHLNKNQQPEIAWMSTNDYQRSRKRNSVPKEKRKIYIYRLIFYFDKLFLNISIEMSRLESMCWTCCGRSNTQTVLVFIRLENGFSSRFGFNLLKILANCCCCCMLHCYRLRWRHFLPASFVPRTSRIPKKCIIVLFGIVFFIIIRGMRHIKVAACVRTNTSIEL